MGLLYRGIRLRPKGISAIEFNKRLLPRSFKIGICIHAIKKYNMAAFFQK